MSTFTLGDPFFEDNNGLRLRLSNGASVAVTPTIAVDATGAPQGGSGNPLNLALSAANSPQVAKVTITGKTLHAAAGAFAWQAPAFDVVVHSVRVRVRTVATGACSIDIGQTAVNATTASDKLIDGLDVHSAASFLGLADQAGANGKAQALVSAGTWITGGAEDASSDLTGLVADVYIVYSAA